MCRAKLQERTPSQVIVQSSYLWARAWVSGSFPSANRQFAEFSSECDRTHLPQNSVYPLSGHGGEAPGHRSHVGPSSGLSPTDGRACCARETRLHNSLYHLAAGLSE